MHEAMVAENILESILDAAKTQQGRPVRALMSCGQINAINDEAMEFAFEAAAMETICEGMKLEVKHLLMKALCRKCNCDFDFDLRSPICPECGESDFAIGDDPPLLLEEIEFE
ncbi:MAG: hydrogenase maturation nickel metallochaperone HypA [Anaerohalosphaeraceae bacterium]|nr:hydrogenase maturation nickel metallochaperone HypA [Anaerohalosphaeraceae bacterium]